jgi:Yip1 domain
MAENDGLASYKLTPTRSRKSAVLHLPGQYLKVLFNPTARTFALEAECANWRMVWFQIFILVLIPFVFGLIRIADRSLPAQVATRSRFLYDILVAFSFGSSIAALILRTLIAPLFFFITVSLQFLLARIFRGAGSYIEQSYTTLLYQVPLALLSSILSAIIVFVQGIDLHFFNPLISFVFFIYGMFLNIAMIKGIHRLTGERSTLVVALYYMILFLVVVGLLVLLASLVIAVIRHIG